jgi:hypothetical protein
MAEFSKDDTRLRAEEEQMRRALGLRDPAPSPSGPVPIRPAPNGPSRPHRRFIRDGEVPVEVVHHEGAGTNQLEAARQTIRALTTAREQAERQLVEAQATIRDLETKLAHERLARDEAAQRASVEREEREKALQLARAELEAERIAKRAAEEQLATALDRSAKAERHRQEVSRSFPSSEQGKSNGAVASGSDLAAGTSKTTSKTGRPRGRPRKTPQAEPDADFVEWWKPGWKDRYR